MSLALQVYEKDVVSIANFNHDAPGSSNGGMGTGPPQLTSALDLKVPQIVGSSRNYEARCKREFCSNTHLYFIHSVSVCTDQTTFMTADDLSIYLWDLERPDSSMRALDIRPAIPDETEVRKRVCKVKLLMCKLAVPPQLGCVPHARILLHLRRESGRRMRFLVSRA